MTAHGRKLAVIGLGCVGLPLAVAFAVPVRRWSARHRSQAD
jgi:UDP-N-acetyl-D-mannosaminuronate dehydrogenase